MISLLLSFTAVLDEFGVSQGRARRAALCAVEGLLMVRTYRLNCATPDVHFLRLVKR